MTNAETSRPPWVSVGAVGAALAIVAGAFGAHALADRLDPRSLTLWETAARYLMYGSLGLIGLGLAAVGRPHRLYGAAGLALVLGTIVFSGTLFGLALGAPRILGAVTPLGGLGMIAGFLLFALAARAGTIG
ncbi:MAG TPA: DUF423 domain-containing protein [Thermoanaerobaculia bacterium]|nr:DUF423 domain-containing protein [Thermoanaerobaculia bacterium]